MCTVRYNGYINKQQGNNIMQYRPLRLHTKHIAKHMDSAMREMDGIGFNVASATPVSVMHKLYSLNPNTLQSMQFWALAAEYTWLKAPHAIYPQDIAFVNSMLNAKYTVGQGATISFPYESFVLFMPKELKFNNMYATTTLVEICTFKQRHVNMNEFHKKATGHHVNEIVLGEHCTEDDVVINAFYTDINNSDQLNNMVVPVKMLMELLELNDPNAYAKVLGALPSDESSYTTTVQLDVDEVKYQQQLLKMIVSMGVYYSAVGDSCLKAGAPITNTKKDTPSGVSPTNHTFGGTVKRIQGVHTRSMHFRSLVHEKYYKGEHANKPRGSRWVFIDEYDVGVSMDKKTIS